MPRQTNGRRRAPDYEKRIVRALRQLTQELDAHSRHLLTGYDITMPQVLCLDELNEKGVMTVTVLAGAIRLSPSTTVGIIDRLEKKGWVKRTRDVIDRRSVFIDITDKGREFILKTPHLLHNKLHDNLKQLIEPEKIRIANALDLLLELMVTKTARPKE
jgi:DNA-binding MarR family transcriptional regulator